MRTTDVIRHYADRWRTLAAWRAHLPALVAIRKMAPGQRRMGLAHPDECRAIVYVSGDLAEDLATVIHELAHLAAPNHANHGEQWCELFIAATAEVTGLEAEGFDLDVPITDLDAQVRDAIADWLARTGQAAVLRAIGAGGSR